MVYSFPKNTSKPFEPSILDSSVIARPLLNAIKDELSLIHWAEANMPKLLEKYNCAFILEPEYPGGVQAAYEAAKGLLEEAKKRFSEMKQEPILEDLSQEGSIHFAVARMESQLRRKIFALNTDLIHQPIKRIIPSLYDVIIDLNQNYPSGREKARRQIAKAVLLAKAQVAGADTDPEQGIRERKSKLSNQYVFARLEARVLFKLVEIDNENAKKLSKSTQNRAKNKTIDNPKSNHQRTEIDTQSLSIESDNSRFRSIYHIWPDFKIASCTTNSISTVKSDAALSSFSASGKDITWAVMDSGIKAEHPHFKLHQNIDEDSDLHVDLTGVPDVPGKNGALIDNYGHGTHVAGIIAGEQIADGSAGTPQTMRAVLRSIEPSEAGGTQKVITQTNHLSAIRGMAPRCKLVSLKVLDEDGHGEVSSLIAAISHIQEINGHGRNLLIHGVNISLGYDFDPEWFACGQSPLCVEINRLVRAGVVVVVAAGNTGYGILNAKARLYSAGMSVTINDPGNAELAITVGSTHRDMPHVYGVSYFSSKGPTGDGRLKPDVVAPGEKILSCAAGKLMVEKASKDQNEEPIDCDYIQDSGTSMAAPHVSGIVAAFLSVRREFIGEPEKVKQIILSTATDLKRDRSFQGAGLVDLMRAIQSV